MSRFRSSPLTGLFATLAELSVDLFSFLRAAVRSRASLVAENLFLRKQLAFYQERAVKPRRLTDAARGALVFWSRWLEWKQALTIVQPETLIGWHRRGFQLFWRWKSKPGRPRLPRNIRELIGQMAKENPTWGPRPRRLRTIPEARDLRLATDGAGLLALESRPAMPDDILTALADVRSQPRAIHRGLRLLGCGDGAVSSTLRARRHGGGNP